MLGIRVCFVLKFFPWEDVDTFCRSIVVVKSCFSFTASERGPDVFGRRAQTGCVTVGLLQTGCQPGDIADASVCLCLDVRDGVPLVPEHTYGRLVQSEFTVQL